MLPGSSVSGLYFWHPESHYFGIGRIGRDQLGGLRPAGGHAGRGGGALAGAEPGGRGRPEAPVEARVEVAAEGPA